jgi:hypothetical protein
MLAGETAPEPATSCRTGRRSSEQTKFVLTPKECARTTCEDASGALKLLSQYAANRAQTAQSQPNVVYTYQWFRREPRRNHAP